jgi:hypothetical protein
LRLVQAVEEDLNRSILAFCVGFDEDLGIVIQVWLKPRQLALRFHSGMSGCVWRTTPNSYAGKILRPLSKIWVSSSRRPVRMKATSSSKLSPGSKHASDSRVIVSGFVSIISSSILIAAGHTFRSSRTRAVGFIAYSLLRSKPRKPTVRGSCLIAPTKFSPSSACVTPVHLSWSTTFFIQSLRREERSCRNWAVELFCGPGAAANSARTSIVSTV